MRSLSEANANKPPQSWSHSQKDEKEIISPLFNPRFTPRLYPSFLFSKCRPTFPPPLQGQLSVPGASITHMMNSLSSKALPEHRQSFFSSWRRHDKMKPTDKGVSILSYRYHERLGKSRVSGLMSDW